MNRSSISNAIRPGHHERGPSLRINRRSSHSLARTLVDFENFDPSQKSLEEYSSIKTALFNHALFRNLDLGLLEELIDQMTRFAVNADDVIYEVGDHADHFFVVYLGEFQRISHTKDIQILTQG